MFESEAAVGDRAKINELSQHVAVSFLVNVHKRGGHQNGSGVFVSRKQLWRLVNDADDRRQIKRKSARISEFWFAVHVRDGRFGASLLHLLHLLLPKQSEINHRHSDRDGKRQIVKQAKRKKNQDSERKGEHLIPKTDWLPVCVSFGRSKVERSNGRTRTTKGCRSRRRSNRLNREKQRPSRGRAKLKRRHVQKFEKSKSNRTNVKLNRPIISAEEPRCRYCGKDEKVVVGKGKDWESSGILNGFG